MKILGRHTLIDALAISLFYGCVGFIGEMALPFIYRASGLSIDAFLPLVGLLFAIVTARMIIVDVLARKTAAPRVTIRPVVTGGGVFPPVRGDEKECQCARCFAERHGGKHPEDPFFMARMILCAICGNKRCPHATDHRHACTGSNEAGQPGSAYE